MVVTQRPHEREVDLKLEEAVIQSEKAEMLVCCYLAEVRERQLFVQFGYANIADYAFTRFAFKERKIPESSLKFRVEGGGGSTHRMLVERETSAGSERATGDPAGRDAAGVEDPEVSEQAKRRRFTAEYKLRIVREADACKGDGDVAALLRREGLYSSHLSSWRRQRDEVAQEGLASRKRGRKAKAEDPRVKELERENARLQRRLARVETMLEIQKKTSELLGIPLNPLDSDETD